MPEPDRSGDPATSFEAALFESLMSLREWQTLDPRAVADLWELVWHDLKTKTEGMTDVHRNRVLTRALLHRLLADKLISQTQLEGLLERLVNPTRRKIDVMIFTVLEKEFTATLAAFGVRASDTQDYVDPSTRYWVRCTTCAGKDGQDVTIGITMIGRARNVVCSNFCRDVFDAFQVDTGVLVGIAAGNREHTSLGDVVGSTSVVDYEGGSVSSAGTKPEPREYPLSPRIRQNFDAFNPDRLNWLERRTACLDDLADAQELIEQEARDYLPKYVPGVVAAGEKLRRDNRILELSANNRKIYALEMEGSGFAAACDGMGVRWVVFRGISDFGSADKDDKWQAVSALHAALAAKAFIENDLRFPAPR